MYNEIATMPASTVTQYENLEGEGRYLALMGNNVPMIPMEEMMTFWQIAGSFISMMYRKTISMMYRKTVRQNEIFA